MAADDGQGWPPELGQYNKQFRETLDKIKRRHDSVVTTVGMDSQWMDGEDYLCGVMLIVLEL